MMLYITPETTVGALLEAYPEVESTLIGMAPALAKLRNPVIRRAVTKAATLEQMAKTGGVNLQTMISKIREAAGQSSPGPPVLQSPDDADQDESWLASGSVVEEVHADAMLERGVHPIGKIREAVGALRPGEVVVLRSSFRPEPLIETMRRAGVAVYSSMQGTAHLTYFGSQSR